MHEGAALCPMGEPLAVHIFDVGARRANIRSTEALRLDEWHHIQVADAQLQRRSIRSLHGPREFGGDTSGHYRAGRGRHMSARLVRYRRLLLSVQLDSSGQLLARVSRVPTARLNASVDLVGGRESAGAA